MREDRLLDPVLLEPQRVKLLLVTDSAGSFGTNVFGLKTLVDTLAASPGPWVDFEVTRAHRGHDADADLQDFRFDAQPLDGYDAIWMFGVAGNGGPSLDETELASLSRFMDGGGGVFATGDHQDLGVAMCGRVPRVRSMRKWYWPNPGPNGEPVAPIVNTEKRYDTLREGHEGGFQFDNQSDDIPQEIVPQLHPLPGAAGSFAPEYPHPLLCGPAGPIRVLPDHAHEGECYVPDDLTMSFTFDGYTIEEYPNLPGGDRLSPEIVAWSNLITGPRPEDSKGRLDPRLFGAISAYDGHRTGVGRVACDSTWHHFFNVNLVGDPNSPDPKKKLGFLASEEGKAVLALIQTYFRNLGVWLARRESRSDMAWKALWAARWHHHVVISFDPDALAAGVEEIGLRELLRVGSAGRAALTQISSPCQVLAWMLDLVAAGNPGLAAELEPLVDPFSPRAAAGPEERGPVPFLYASEVLDAALGAALYAVAERSPVEDRAAARAWAVETSFPDLARRAVQAASLRVAEAAERSRESFGSWLQTLRSIL